MRKPLSMKRLHQLSSNFIIEQGYEGSEGDKVFSATAAEYAQAIIQPLIFDFLRYVWDHKDDEDLLDLPVFRKK